MNNLLCKICTSKLTQPKLCPHCSQIFCHSCITTYLAQKHFCPTCDNYIIDLIDCSRLVQQVEQVVSARNSQIFNLTNKLCRLHELQLIYFCGDCKVWICADCGVIGDKHRAHKILNRQEAQSCNKEQLRNQITKLNQKLLKNSKKKQKCLLDLQIYKAELKWSKKRIQRYCEQLINKIDLQGEKQINQLVDKIKEYQIILQQIKDKKNQIQKIIEGGQNSSIKKIQTLKNITHNNPQKNWLSASNFSISGFEQVDQQESVFLNKVRKIETIEQIFPNFVNFTYEFDYHTLKHDNFHYSHYFQLWGQDWRLKIYPNGNSGVAGKFLSVFLQLADNHRLQVSKRYVYRIELLSLNKAGSTIVKQYCSVFDGGQSWGYSDYLNLAHLNQYLHEGKLLFSVGIRNQTYHGLCTDLKKYITKIQNQNKVLQKLLCQGQNQHQNSYLKTSKMKQQYSQISYSEIHLDQPSSDIQVSLIST